MILYDQHQVFDTYFFLCPTSHSNHEEKQRNFLDSFFKFLSNIEVGNLNFQEFWSAIQITSFRSEIF